MEARAPFDVMLTGRFASSTTKSVSERAAQNSALHLAKQLRLRE